MADFNSKDFQIQLIHDLINNSPNIKDMKVFEQYLPTVREVDLHGEYGSIDKINVELSFIYNYNGEQIPLHIIFNGTLYFYLIKTPRSGDGYNTPNVGGDIQFGDNDYSAIEVTLMTPEGDTITSADWINNTEEIADQLGNKVLDKYIGELSYEA